MTRFVNLQDLKKSYMSQGFKIKLVISCYISSLLLYKAQYRPLYKTEGRRREKQDEDERKEAGVKG